MPCIKIEKTRLSNFEKPAEAGYLRLTSLLTPLLKQGASNGGPLTNPCMAVISVNDQMWFRSIQIPFAFARRLDFPGALVSFQRTSAGLLCCCLHPALAGVSVQNAICFKPAFSRLFDVACSR